MKGFGRHVAASIAISIVFLVCAIAIGMGAGPASAPQKVAEGANAFKIPSIVANQAQTEQVTVPAEAAAEPEPAVPEATATEAETPEPAPVAVTPAPASPPVQDPAVQDPEVVPAKPPTPQPDPTILLNPPKDLVGTFVPGINAYVQLTWNANNSKVNHFHVYRLVAGDPLPPNLQPIAEPKKTKYSDYAIQPGLTYRYWVTAVDRSGQSSGPSNTVDVKTFSNAPPAAPQGVQAWAIDPGVSIDWLPNTDKNLAGYNVYEPKGNRGNWRKLNSQPVMDNHYYYAGGAVGKTYAVAAVNFSGVESQYVKAQAVATTPVTYEESDPSIVVEGLWAYEVYTGPTNGKIRVAGDKGAKLNFKFEGSQVKMIVAKYWTCGSANIYLDGKLISTVNLYSQTTTYNVIQVDMPGIKRGAHVLTIEALGSGNPEGTYNFINVDCFQVR